MKQHDMEWQSVLASEETEDNTLLKQIALVLGLGTLGVILLIGLIYLPLSVTMAPIPADPGSGVSVEQTLGAEYVLQSSFLSGRYVIPLLVSLLGAGAILFYVLRVKAKKAWRR
ncbi:MAG: hypothetical protein HY667_06610 [Chloroflexi bacterium]|nr:hypothetical protein [Chloroflexota bacterium]